MIIGDPATRPELEGYTSEASGNRTVYIREGFRDAVVDLGFIQGTAQTDPIETRGGRVRHEVHELSDGTRALWKRCRRGGLIEPLFGDRHFDVRRFFAELRITALAEARGIRVARILALAIEPHAHEKSTGLGGTPVGAKRVELLTAMVDDAVDVGDALAQGALTQSQRQRLMRAVAAELRCFHGEGFHHGDLNLKNILWRQDRAGSIEVTLIDLDPGARPTPDATPRHRNLLRLWRSYLKGEHASQWRLSATDLYRFVHEYFRADKAAIAAFWRRASRSRRLSRLRYGLRPRPRSKIGGPVGS